jgi:hypothetical protein
MGERGLVQFSIGFRGTIVTALMAVVVGCGVDQTDLALKIVDARSGQAIAGANVSVNDRQAQTTSQGIVHFTLRPQTYDVTVDEPSHLPLTTTLVVFAGAPSARTIGLYPKPTDPNAPTPAPTGAPDPVVSGAPPVPLPPRPSADAGVAVFGRVMDESGGRVPNAVVMTEIGFGTALGTATTNAQGEYRIEHAPRGQQLRVTVAADGFNAVTRTIVPKTDWRVDFSGQFALRSSVTPAPAPNSPVRIMLQGKLQDTYGHSLDGVFVHVEAYNVRYPFDKIVVGHNGRYELLVPTELPLRFTASKPGYRSTTFVQSVPASTFGDAAQVDFSGPRALDLAPVSEMGIRALAPKVVR